MTAAEEGYPAWLGGLPKFLYVLGTPEASTCQKLCALAKETDLGWILVQPGGACTSYLVGHCGASNDSVEDFRILKGWRYGNPLIHSSS